jgi:hypothetical protein
VIRIGKKTVADLKDGGRDEMPDERRLRLSIRWRYIISEPSVALELDSVLSIGLFIGDAPLFAPVVYREGDGVASKKPGYFYGEDNGCVVLHSLWRALQTGELIDIEDYIEPFFRLIISSSATLLEPMDAKSEWMDVVVIIQHGGSWNSDAMGGSGPAACLSVERKDFKRFFYDLLDEALLASDELSRTMLLDAFNDALAQRQHHLRM